MTFEQVKQRVPKLGKSLGFTEDGKDPDTSDDTGYRSETLPFYYLDKPAFAGVDTLKLGFLDNRLVNMAIEYDGETRWNNANEFISKVAPSLGLPTTGWSNERRGGSSLSCDGFRVTVTASYGAASLSFSETGIEDIRTQRRQAIEQKKKDTFKP